MPVHSTQYGVALRCRSLVLAVLLGIGWLNVPGELTRGGHTATSSKTDTHDVAKAQPDHPWDQFPFDSRELWKFRLTTRR